MQVGGELLGDPLETHGHALEVWCLGCSEEGDAQQTGGVVTAG